MPMTDFPTAEKIAALLHFSLLFCNRRAVDRRRRPFGKVVDRPIQYGHLPSSAIIRSMSIAEAGMRCLENCTWCRGGCRSGRLARARLLELNSAEARLIWQRWAMSSAGKMSLGMFLLGLFKALSQTQRDSN